MVIFSHGIGAGYDAETALVCGGFVILPTVVLLCLVAWVADAPRAAWAAFAVAGLSYAVALLNVSGYTPSDNWEVTDLQVIGRRQAERYGLLTVAAGVSLVTFGLRRALRRLWPNQELPRQRLSDAERLEVVEGMVSRGMVSVDEADSMRRRLAPKGNVQDAEPHRTA